MADTAMRLDRFLWFVRLVKTRPLAQALAEQGHFRIDGRPIAKAHVAVRPGNVLTFALNGTVRMLRIEALPARRGPCTEARTCYCDLANASQADRQD
ncbi:RNA-binding protein [Sphingomonas sp. Leaf17]|uniref:RNA-binding S4 domain-containing protein n=1 Tax=Sphingomonas sp. Leaf17 TaxID=1735683 RepID=UPI0006F42740|nr:RNA-binding S4 domain-containing protein [Sphingomonas sp. Leaf17]KQM68049.1 RNA-binding protein [Sphingomonas sp. Leaf17]